MSLEDSDYTFIVIIEIHHCNVSSVLNEMKVVHFSWMSTLV